ncbi:unnamed protein product [Effrenium voratum]|uniref:Uncharacterized protein n=1 Tax=Effrenium voratum TaxID=2562239 RepID=A0AA36JJY0_9DINO|nr:unnamed protein product [Effrenium voratum]CAJ1422361.1 unnamed protein product [Effrenium voratum]
MAEEVNGLRIITLSPFEIHFSQTRIRFEFQDGRTLQTALEETKARDTTFEEEDAILLAPPFPRIEVTRWRCKLRDAEGAPRIDPETGLELYSQEERWFTFDNRRLCCLQRAAAAKWPKKVCCEVYEIPPALARTRELRKFDTRSSGFSVLVGRREAQNLDTWCWRTEVGVPAVQESEPGVVMPGLRRRRPESERQGAGHFRGRRREAKEEEEEAERSFPLQLLRSFLLFMIIYLSLRVCMILWRKYKAGSGTDSVGELENSSL